MANQTCSIENCRGRGPKPVPAKDSDRGNEAQELLPDHQAVRHNIDALLNQQLRTTLRLCIAKFAARPTVGAAPAQLLADLYNREIGVVRLILSFVGPNQANYDGHVDGSSSVSNASVAQRQNLDD